MIRRFRELESTQKYCLEHLEEFGRCEVVICERQTQGVGRSGRSWITNRESLTFSIFLETLPSANVSIRVSQCVKKSLEYFKIHSVSVKWPNDIYIERNSREGRKIGGVLINSLYVKEKHAYVIGIGLNIGGDLPYCTLEECKVKIDKEALFLEIVKRVEEEIVGENVDGVEGIGGVEGMCGREKKEEGEKEREKEREKKKKLYSHSDIGFLHEYVIFQGKPHRIVTAEDILQITDGTKTITITPEQYSYKKETNTICNK